MNVTIEIHYIAASRLTQSGSFLLRGKQPVQVALNFWKQIKKEMSFHAKLEKVIVDGDKDITDLVKESEKSEWRNVENNCDLPF
ncbi:hypothetical protein [Bacillus sp. EB600]|uniref:hypothetical protein n=1 Tax=Bacillus sp. EB600 TaxID=2806345 RepID=UPI0021098776|nr:hypothetical protein [Bacillus sp. EB600]MCQ6281608.1 hypothetical protein [Bacillus sp. EB600]